MLNCSIRPTSKKLFDISNGSIFDLINKEYILSQVSGWSLGFTAIDLNDNATMPTATIGNIIIWGSQIFWNSGLLELNTNKLVITGVEEHQKSFLILNKLNNAEQYKGILIPSINSSTTIYNFIGIDYNPIATENTFFVSKNIGYDQVQNIINSSSVSNSDLGIFKCYKLICENIDVLNSDLNINTTTLNIDSTNTIILNSTAPTIVNFNSWTITKAWIDSLGNLNSNEIFWNKYNILSDRNYKWNIINVKENVDIFNNIINLNIFNFTYNNDPKKNINLGIIAQDVIKKFSYIWNEIYHDNNCLSDCECNKKPNILHINYNSLFLYHILWFQYFYKNHFKKLKNNFYKQKKILQKKYNDLEKMYIDLNDNYKVLESKFIKIINYLKIDFI